MHADAHKIISTTAVAVLLKQLNQVNNNVTQHSHHRIALARTWQTVKLKQFIRIAIAQEKILLLPKTLHSILHYVFAMVLNAIVVSPNNRYWHKQQY